MISDGAKVALTLVGIIFIFFFSMGLTDWLDHKMRMKEINAQHEKTMEEIDKRIDLLKEYFKGD